jgi:acyl-coenzyme A synthetase/AMP-(fatty) acid ligase
MDPFSVDFDPRWAKRLADGSLARQRYLAHVVGQALDLLTREQIGVIFTTPPTLSALAARMNEQQRESIRGVHYGGLSLTPDTMNEFRSLFSNAVHLSGYGNTLFGVAMEVADDPRIALDYFPCGERLRIQVVADDWPRRECEYGETGRVIFDRLDETCLLIGVMERDEAERIPACSAARSIGWSGDGLRNPRPRAQTAAKLQLGIY